jgi:hypothetical protein
LSFIQLKSKKFKDINNEMIISKENEGIKEETSSLMGFRDG